jgi:predicted small lipoprotein YifL
MTLFSLSGCGIKGPLYLPESEQQKQEKLLKKDTEKAVKQADTQAKEK